MRPFRKLISIDNAIELLLGSVRPIERVEKVRTEEAVERVCAEDLEAAFDIPPFDRGAMDGYAVVAEETYGADKFRPRIFRIVDRIHAGEKPRTPIEGDACAQIATGAPMPPGSDAVVMVEDTEKYEDVIHVFKPVHPGENVSPKGEDIEKGELILRKGAYLTPGKVGVLASLGIQEVKVFSKPKVAILPTGKEIAPLGASLKEGQVYDVNSYTLSQIVIQNGCLPVMLDIVEDAVAPLKKAILGALSADLLLICGGSSVGETDVLLDVCEDLGDVLFHGIQIKPGKPTLLARMKEKTALGLPGYPASCLINAYVLLVPALRKMARLPARREEVVELPLSRRVPSSSGRHEYLTVKIEGGLAKPVFKESGTITSLANADGYIEIPVEVPLLEKGEKVRVKLF